MRIFKKIIFFLLFLALLAGVFAYKKNGDFSKKSFFSVQLEMKNWLQNKVEKSSTSKEENNTVNTSIPFVRTAKVTPANTSQLNLSGVIKARHETPLSFQIGGRIKARMAETGQHVSKDEILFKLDSRDIQENINTAQADVNAAQASVYSAQENIKTAQSNLSAAQAQLKTSLSELKRTQLLHKKRVVSTQVLEKTQLAEQQANAQVNAAKAQLKATRALVDAAKSQVSAAKARLAQAKNAKGYTALKSPESGTLLNVSGEVGQVVAAGQKLAVLAIDGNREVEVAMPNYQKTPKTGVLISPQGNRVPLKLRLISAAVDPQSRTLQVRYTIQKEDLGLELNAIVRTEFSNNDKKNSSHSLFSIPISALDERAKGAQVWKIINGHAIAKPVTVVRLTTDTAIVKGDLKLGESIISLGTHLLTPNMAVQVLCQEQCND